MACFPAARSNFALTRDLHESCGYTQSSSFAEKQSCARCSIEYDSRVVVCPSDGETLVSKTADAKARIFVERYEILELLGKGGMSAVYQARHLLMKKDVAIKMMHKHTDSDTVSVRRFQQETEATSKLSHRTAI